MKPKFQLQFLRYTRFFSVASALLSCLFLLAPFHRHLDNLSSFMGPAFWGAFAVWLCTLPFLRTEKWLALLASLALLVNSSFLLELYLPVESGVSVTSNSAAPIKLAVVNVQTSNREFHRVKNWLWAFQPDIAVLIETDQGWVDAMKELDRYYPSQVSEARDHNFGMALVSRYPILSSEVLHFSSTDIPSLNVLLESPTGPVRVLVTHTLPPVSHDWFTDRNQHLKKLGEWSRTIKEPLILAGDLNITPWSSHFQVLTEGTDLNHIRKAFGVKPTWPSFFPAFLRTPIDHALISSRFQVRGVRVGPKIGGDHLPLEVELNRRQ